MADAEEWWKKKSSGPADVAKAAEEAALGRAFQAASAKLTAGELYKLMPTRLPQTHHLEVGGFKHIGIARYPIDKWAEEGMPAMDIKGWYRLCAKIAKKDMKNLGNIFTLCAKQFSETEQWEIE